MHGAQTFPGHPPSPVAEALELLRQLTSRHGPLPDEVRSLAPFTTVSDEECMERYQRGDAAAFRVLYLRYRDRLHRYLLRLATHAAEAEEVFQEAWMAVIRGRDGYRSGHNFAGWLFSVAHRRAADRWRALSRHAPEWRRPLDEEVLEQHASPALHGPDAQCHNEALARAMQDAVQALPLPQREAFLLRAEAGLGVEDIAVATGVSHETAKSRLRYAQRRLRDALEAWR
jgi:RNA polymerase sigma-70 factor, ECF subfamily